jgi:homoserine trans-succinylase
VWSVGYDIVVGTAKGEWTVAARERAGRMLVLVQGHPEYASTVLLREFRRDLRRFVSGAAPVPPRIPVGYLDESGEVLLRAWSLSMERSSPAEWHTSSFDALTDHIVSHWTDAAVQLFTNWLADAGSRTPDPLTVGPARA